VSDDTSKNEAGRLPDETWDGLPDEAKGLIRSLQSDRGDAAKYRTQLRDTEKERDTLKASNDTLTSEVDDLKANVPDVDAAVTAAVDAALSDVKPSLREARVKAAASGVIQHPADAVKLIDWTDVDPDDGDTIDIKITEFADSRPDLKVKTGTPPPRGSVSGAGTATSWARQVS